MNELQSSFMGYVLLFKQSQKSQVTGGQNKTLYELDIPQEDTRSVEMTNSTDSHSCIT